jgi:UDP-GlcNAc:undecaprenyl-phosphate GlcNAc-1-phosphate transferase
MIDLSLILLGTFSFVLCLVLTPLVRHAFHRMGMLDRPQGVRKIHSTPIPRVGGIAVMTAYVAAFGLVMLLPVPAGSMMKAHLSFMINLAPAAALIFAVGLSDDLFDLRPWQKLLGQVAASGVAYWGGVRILHVAELPMPGWLSLPLTVFWLVGCTNAFNLIDGADGIAAGVGFFATITMLLVALLQDHLTLQIVTVPLAGCLLAFLAYNFSPASIFLGDCGSLWIGFLLGCYGVLWVEKCSTLLALTAPVIAMSVPLLDTWLALLRRYIRHRPLLGPDNRHIHHRLLARGFAPRRVALILYVVSGMAAAFALLISTAAAHYAGLAVVVFCLCALIGIRALGYAEFKIARQVLTQGALWHMVNMRLSLENVAGSLGDAKTADEWWKVFLGACREFGFDEASVEFGGRFYHSAETTEESLGCWSLRIPLSESNCVFLTRRFGCNVMPETMDEFVTVLRRAVQARAGNGIPFLPQQPAVAAKPGLMTLAKRRAV